MKLMPNKAALVKAMRERATKDQLPLTHDMCSYAMMLELAIEQRPFDWEHFTEAWSRARRCYNEYTGEKFE